MALTDKLTAIGDAVRDVQGISKYVWATPKENMTKICKTDNIDDAGYASSPYAANSDWWKQVNIPGASSITVDVYYSCQGGNADYFDIYRGYWTSKPSSTSYDVATNLSGNIKSKTGDYKNMNHSTYTVNSATVSFHFRSGSGSTNYYGFYALVSGVSVGTPYATEEIDETKLITLDEMATGINTFTEPTGVIRIISGSAITSPSTGIRFSFTSAVQTFISNYRKNNKPMYFIYDQDTSSSGASRYAPLILRINKDNSCENLSTPQYTKDVYGNQVRNMLDADNSSEYRWTYGLSYSFTDDYLDIYGAAPSDYPVYKSNGGGNAGILLIP